jgi:hypothetical protein
MTTLFGPWCQYSWYWKLVACWFGALDWAFLCYLFICHFRHRKMGLRSQVCFAVDCSVVCVSLCSADCHIMSLFGKFLEVLKASILHEMGSWHLCCVLANSFERYVSKECSDIFSYNPTPFQTCRGIHPESCTVGTGSLWWVKRLECDTDHPPAISAEVKGRAVPLIPHRSSWALLVWALF